MGGALSNTRMLKSCLCLNSAHRLHFQTSIPRSWPIWKQFVNEESSKPKTRDRLKCAPAEDTLQPNLILHPLFQLLDGLQDELRQLLKSGGIGGELRSGFGVEFG